MRPYAYAENLLFTARHAAVSFADTFCHYKVSSQFGRPGRRGIVMSRNNTAGTGRALVAKAAGIATTAAAGALAMAIAAPHAAAEIPAEAPTSLQSTIDELLDQMQAAAAQDSALPFATPGNMALLQGALQNLLFQQLMLYTHGMYPTDPFLNEFGMTTEAATNTRQFTELPTPGNFYWITEGLDPKATYAVTGDFNDAKN